jgi:hypothetical protein
MRRGGGVVDEALYLVASPLGLGSLLAAIGLSVWTGLSIWGGASSSEEGFRLREAWDVSAYFYVGIPLMALAVAAAAFVHPERAWRWPVSLVAGHQLGVMLVGVGMQSGLSLVILTLSIGILLAAMLGVPAMLGAMAARALEERAY